MNLSRWRQEMPCEHSAGGERRRPRVVIFAADARPRVEVLDLAEDAALGSSFCHHGIDWRVTGIRPSSRVLIAEPLKRG